MKKLTVIFLLVCFLVLLCSCNMTIKTPTNGIWYCEELDMEIDFFLQANGNKNCVKIYDEKGSYEIYRCGIEHGNYFLIFPLDQYVSDDLISGSMKYHNDVFQVITSKNGKKEKYSFVWNGPSPYYDNPRNMLTKVYFEDQLSEIANYSGRFNELLSEYNAYRITKKDYGYRVSFKGESKAVNVMYDDEGNKLYENICGVSKNILYFQQASVKTLENVKLIDPNGDYGLVWDGGDGSLKKSYHYTEEDEFIEITYDSENVITNIYNELL